MATQITVGSSQMMKQIFAVLLTRSAPIPAPPLSIALWAWVGQGLEVIDGRRASRSFRLVCQLHLVSREHLLHHVHSIRHGTGCHRAKQHPSPTSPSCLLRLLLCLRITYLRFLMKGKPTTKFWKLVEVRQPSKPDPDPTPPTLTTEPCPPSQP